MVFSPNLPPRNALLLPQINFLTSTVGLSLFRKKHPLTGQREREVTMMLRSSSTPVLGSLLSSFSDSPNTHHLSEFHGTTTTTTTSTQRHTPSSTKISCGALFQSPPGYRAGFRRVLSEGNLQELADAADELTLSKKSGRRSRLEAIPSISSRHNNNVDSEEEDEEDLELGQQLRKEQQLVLKGQEDGKMYLATGLGMSGMSLTDAAAAGGGGGSPGIYRRSGFGGGGDDRTMEEHYKKMLEGDPGNPMFLRNCAQFLHQEKGNPERAEEFYSRAILADPKDGEILSQYAKLIWEHHRDKNRAANYFDRAVQAAAEDSHIHAAYASFLWDAEDDEDEHVAAPSPFRQGFMASATA